MIQYIPRVFKQFTDEDYLRGAVETANWLKTLEVKTEHGKIWKNYPDDQNGFGRDIMLFGRPIFIPVLPVLVFFTFVYMKQRGTNSIWRKQRQQQIILFLLRQMPAGMKRH